MRADPTILTDANGEPQRAAGIYKTPANPLTLVFVDMQGEGTAYTLTSIEAQEMGRHLLQAAGLDRRAWALAAAWCLQHAQEGEWHQGPSAGSA
jgi:hypothetical protein